MVRPELYTILLLHPLQDVARCSQSKVALAMHSIMKHFYTQAVQALPAVPASTGAVVLPALPQASPLAPQRPSAVSALAIAPVPWQRASQRETEERPELDPPHPPTTR